MTLKYSLMQPPHSRSKPNKLTSRTPPPLPAPQSIVPMTLTYIVVTLSRSKVSPGCPSQAVVVEVGDPLHWRSTLRGETVSSYGNWMIRYIYTIYIGCNFFYQYLIWFKFSFLSLSEMVTSIYIFVMYFLIYLHPQCSVQLNLTIL